MGNKLCIGKEVKESPSRRALTKKVIEHNFNGTQVCISRGEIFEENVDAIVIVTNKKLKPSNQTA
jgi:hypothetical protein